MRHRKSGRHLNRTSTHRRAMFRNMAASLIEHEWIKTTLPKAKELRRVVEPLITLAKHDSVANRRLAFARTRNAAAVAKLFTDLGPRYVERPGGYTRILKCGHRRGDAAPMAYVELINRPLPTPDEDEVQELPAASREASQAAPAAAPAKAAAADPAASTVEQEVPSVQGEAVDAAAETAPSGDAAAADTDQPEK